MRLDNVAFDRVDAGVSSTSFDNWIQILSRCVAALANQATAGLTNIVQSIWRTSVSRPLDTPRFISECIERGV